MTELVTGAGENREQVRTLWSETEKASETGWGWDGWMSTV